MTRQIIQKNPPYRWNIGHIFTKLNSLKKKLLIEPKHTKKWFIMQYKREIMQTKKHILFLEDLVKKYENNEDIK
jgi:hypothetical protein